MKSVFDKKREFCPLCSSRIINSHFYIKRNKNSFSVDKCGSCGFIFMNPPYSDNSIKEFYNESYYLSKADYSYHDERENAVYSNYVWKARIKNIRKFVKSGYFLDIGCSFGLFLKCASEFFKTYGIEISEYSAEYAAKNSNSFVLNEGWENFSTDIKFNCITMIELIEHIKEPSAFISKIFELLEPGGVAVIQTADMSAWQAVKAGSDYHYFLPGHLSYFSEKNLIDALTRTGFRYVRVFRPVDFPLIAKLLKSRGGFRKLSDYGAWMKIILYHLKGYIKIKGRNLTSSMVIYAFK